MKKRRYKGERPTHGVLVAAYERGAVRWELWERFPPHIPMSETWRNLKLIALPSQRHKANYWFGWHIEDERFSNSHDAAILREHGADLLTWCEAVLTDPDTAALVYGCEIGDTG